MTEANTLGDVLDQQAEEITRLRSELAEAKAALEKARETGAVLRQRAAELNLSMERWRLLGAVVSVSEDHVRQEAVGAAIDAWDALPSHPGPESREQVGAAAQDKRIWCPQCGGGVAGDEDGCCATCGADLIRPEVLRAIRCKPAPGRLS